MAGDDTSRRQGPAHGVPAAPGSLGTAPTEAISVASLGTARTEAVAVSSLATARTEAVAVPSLATAPTEAVAIPPHANAVAPSHAATAFAPTVTGPAFQPPPAGVGLVSPLAPPASAPVPAPRPPRRSLALVAAAASVLILALLAALFLGGQRSLWRRAFGRSHAAGVGPAVAGGFASLTRDQIRARIEEAGHRVTSETTNEGVTTWQLEPLPLGAASVKLFHFAEMAQADQHFATLRTAGGAVARDGKAILHVSLPLPGPSAALRDRITR